mmetsp:Transcript_40952/g.103164  ORF Transcript_40952/g.103164 Transcript_40952/m.103164 type:complete len:300 (+) Transcript_40952:40-939(+)
MAESNQNQKFSLLLPEGWKSIISSWLTEDAPSFDVGGYVAGDQHRVAYLYLKNDGVLAGVPFVDALFEHVNCKVSWLEEEGSEHVGVRADSPVVVGTVEGAANRLLQAERVALNVLARASGIATRCRAFRKCCEEHKFKGVVAGSRKTTPLFRLVEKYAMVVGGVDPHRMDLSSMVMIKDNHIAAAGSIRSAVEAAQQVSGFSVKIEVECRNDDDAVKAVNAGASVVMLDNFGPEKAAASAAALRAKFPDKHFLIEVSGGVSAEALSSYFSDHIDVISTSAAHQGVPHIDFSMKIHRHK